MKNFYEVLRVRTNATQAQIRNAYMGLITKYHPDVYKGDKQYASRYTSILTEAYATLNNETRRAEYDLKHGINSNPNRKQIRKEDKEIARAIKEEKKTPRQNYEQQMSAKYFRNAERKRPRRNNILKKIFTSKLFYTLLFVLSVEVLIIVLVFAK